MYSQFRLHGTNQHCRNKWHVSVWQDLMTAFISHHSRYSKTVIYSINVTLLPPIDVTEGQTQTHNLCCQRPDTPAALSARCLLLGKCCFHWLGRRFLNCFLAVEIFCLWQSDIRVSLKLMYFKFGVTFFVNVDTPASRCAWNQYRWFQSIDKRLICAILHHVRVVFLRCRVIFRQLRGHIIDNDTHLCYQIIV